MEKKKKTEWYQPTHLLLFRKEYLLILKDWLKKIKGIYSQLSTWISNMTEFISDSLQTLGFVITKMIFLHEALSISCAAHPFPWLLYCTFPHIVDALVVLVLSYTLSVSNRTVPAIYFCVLWRKLILGQEHCAECLGFTVLLSTYHVINYTDTSA